MGPMDKEGKTIWVLCSAARAVENEIARASKQPSPGHSVLGSVREFSNLLGGFGEMRRAATRRRFVGDDGRCTFGHLCLSLIVNLIVRPQ